jgi:aspartate kinase
VQNTSKDGTTDISFTLPVADLPKADPIVAAVAADVGAAGVTHDTDIAKVSVIGAGMKSSPGIAARMFRTLADRAINIEMISTSTIRVSVVVPADKVTEAVRSLHTTFGLDSGQDYAAPLPERR